MTVLERDRPTTTIDERARPVRSPRRRTRARLAAAVAVALLGGGGVVAAAGLVPDDVREALGLADGGSDAGLRAEADRAQLRASASTADGGTVQLWTAPTAGGGQCGYLRRLRADGGAQSAPGVGCSSEAITATPPRENAIELQAESSAAGSALYALRRLLRPESS